MWGPGSALCSGPCLAVTLAGVLFVETICCMDQRWGIAICILVVRRSDFRPWRSLILDDLLWCVCESVCTVCTRILCVRRSVWDTPAHVQSVMRVVILLADMHKGQECHFVPRGCLSKGVGQVATGDEVRESPGRWQPVRHTARTTLPSVTKRGDVVPSQKS